MTEVPKKTKVSPALMKRLRDCDKKKVAIQQFVNMVSENGRRQLVDLQNELHKVWQDIAKETGVDINNVSWTGHANEDIILPVQINLNVDQEG